MGRQAGALEQPAKNSRYTGRHTGRQTTKHTRHTYTEDRCTNTNRRIPHTRNTSGASRHRRIPLLPRKNTRNAHCCTCSKPGGLVPPPSSHCPTSQTSPLGWKPRAFPIACCPINPWPPVAAKVLTTTHERKQYAPPLIYTSSIAHTLSGTAASPCASKPSQQTSYHT